MGDGWLRWVHAGLGEYMTWLGGCMAGLGGCMAGLGGLGPLIT